MDKYQYFEIKKQDILDKNLSPEETEKLIKKLAKELNI